MSTQSCSNCGHPMPATASFCVNCGQMQPAPAVAIAPTEGGPVPWRALEALPIFIISFLATLVVMLILAVFISGDTLVVAGVGINELMTLAVVLIWVKQRHHLGPGSLAWRGLSAENIGIGTAVGFAGIIVSIIVGIIVTTIVGAFQHGSVKAPDQIPLDHSPTGIVLAIIGISVIVLAPIAEETFFRGFLFRGLRRWMRAGPAIATSAAIFALSHLIPLVMPPIFALGILLALIVEQRDSIVPSVVAHMTFNTFGFIFQFVLKH